MINPLANPTELKRLSKASLLANMVKQLKTSTNKKQNEPGEMLVSDYILTVINFQRHAPKKTVPQVRETKAHRLVAANTRARNSLNAHTIAAIGGRSPGQFKMKRFADVISKVALQRGSGGGPSSTHAYSHVPGTPEILEQLQQFNTNTKDPP